MPHALNGCWHAAVAGFALAISLSPAQATADESAAVNDPRNFQGTWQRVRNGMTEDFVLGVDLPYKPEAQNLAADHLQWFKEGRSKASAHLTCRPTGVQGVTAPKSAILILQTPAKMYVITQEDREVRFVYMNQVHPRKIKPSYSGNSIGHWDGNTLVIDTIGFNGKGQLDEMGNPHSDQLHFVERWTKSADGNTLTAQFTITDPVYYTRPFTKTRRWQRAPGARIADYDCSENPRADDFENLTFENDWFKPTCVREVNNGVTADKVVCTPNSKSRAK
jgi:hypothetical protein